MVSRLHVSVPVFVVSDFTGETAESVAKAASRQFNADSVSIKRFRYITTLEEAGKVVVQAKEENALLVCTFVNEKIRLFVVGEAEKLGVACTDLFGSLLHALTSLVGKKPPPPPLWRWGQLLRLRDMCKSGADLRTSSGHAHGVHTSPPWWGALLLLQETRDHPHAFARQSCPRRLASQSRIVAGSHQGLPASSRPSGSGICPRECHDRTVDGCT